MWFVLSTVTAIYVNVTLLTVESLQMLVLSAVFAKEHVKKSLNIRSQVAIYFPQLYIHSKLNYSVYLVIKFFKSSPMRNFMLKCPPEMLCNN